MRLPRASLTFDFENTFPLPLPEAVTAGVVEAEDAGDETAVRAIHAEHGSELLSVLANLDAIAEARVSDTDPRTGRRPRGAAARKKLDAFLRTEPGRLKSRFTSLMDAYADAFGANAGEQFEAFVRARHGGRDLQVEVAERYPMPVPEPLAHAVANGHFGMEDERAPVNPSRDEVLDITRHHGEHMVELLEQLQEIESRLADASAERRPAIVAEKDRVRCAYQALVALYAEDFGEGPAQQLAAWAEACIGVPIIKRSGGAGGTPAAPVRPAGTP